jgi:hypothetical protein
MESYILIACIGYVYTIISDLRAYYYPFPHYPTTHYLHRYILGIFGYNYSSILY